MKIKRIKKVAVDFDGTVVKHEYPLVGPDAPGAVALLRRMAADGRQLILFTMRSGKELADAVDWFAARGIPLYGVNRDPDQSSWTDSPKAYADAYIDDAAVGCPTVWEVGYAGRPYVNWEAMELWYECLKVSEATEHIKSKQQD